MTNAISTADHRRIFQRAVRENITMAEARRRIAEDRWTACDRRLAERRCGTQDEACAAAEERQLQWWQR